MHRFAEDRGVSAVVVALSSSVLVSMAAIVIDMGMLLTERAALQNAADAAVLAAMHELPDGEAATAVAIEYATLNGVPAEDVTVVTPFLADPYQIEVTVEQERSLWLSAVMGEASRVVVAAASAQAEPGGEGWAIYSGNDEKELVINHDLTLVDGGAHSEDDVKLNGKEITIEGDVEAVGTIDEDGDQIDAPDQTEGAASIPIDEYAELIGLDDLAATELAAAQSTAGCTVSGDLKIKAKSTVNAYNHCSAVYVTGKIEVEKKNLTIPYSLIAEDDIMFKKKKITVEGPLIYSIEGGIKVEGDRGNFQSTFYAPTDKIEFNNSGKKGVTVIGRLVGDEVILNGPEITIDSSSLTGGTSSFRLTG